MSKRSFKDTLRHMFLLHTLLPISLLFVLFLLFVVVNSRLELISQTTEAGKQIRGELHNVFTTYLGEMQQTAGLEAVKSFALSGSREPEVFERFYEFNNRQQVKSILTIADRDGKVLAVSTNDNSASTDQAIGAIARRMFAQELASLTETNRIRFEHDRFTSYTFAHEIRGNNGPLGYLIYQLRDEDLQKLIFVQHNEIAVVTDPYHSVIVSTSGVVRGLMDKYSLANKPQGYVWIDEGRYYSKETLVPGSPWHIYTLSAAQSNHAAYMSLAVFFLLASLLLWMLIRYSSRIVAARQSRAMEKLIYAVKELQLGHMDSYVYIGSGDEFETLANQYNLMLRRLNELVAKNEELSDLRRVIEVKHLQSQFHPHFIFNVLEMLRYAIVVDDKLAQDIVLTLSRHLRYSIGNDKDHVVLGTDLTYIAGYMKLQQMRFKDRLHYNEQVDDAAKAALVPRLMLQPVIENAIKYGYRQRQSVAITVAGRVEAADLIIEVRDNGGGMSKQRLEEVRTIMTSQDNRAPHIGLHNLHRRLVLMYGEGCGIQIESIEGEGTLVTFILPYREEEASNV